MIKLKKEFAKNSSRFQNKKSDGWHKLSQKLLNRGNATFKPRGSEFRAPRSCTIGGTQCPEPGDQGSGFLEVSQ